MTPGLNQPSNVYEDDMRAVSLIYVEMLDGCEGYKREFEWFIEVVGKAAAITADGVRHQSVRFRFFGFTVSEVDRQ